MREKRTVTSRIIIVLLIALAPLCVSAADWPQYRGPNHDGVSLDRIRTNWAAAPLRVVWRVPLTDGFSSFAVSQDRAVTMVTQTNAEVCVALDANTGAELWRRALDQAHFDGSGGAGDGPRATPTIQSNRVYVLTNTLKLWCLDLANGSTIWQTNVDANAGVIGWQAAASPLLDGGYLYINNNAPTNTLLAVRASDGQIAWKRQTDPMTHSTPVAATIDGVRQIIYYTQTGLVSVHPGTGDVLWRYAIPYSTSSAISPIVGGNFVFAGAAYSTGGHGVRVAWNGSTWTTTNSYHIAGNSIGNHWSSPVCSQGYLYGLFGSYNSCALKCVNITNGAVAWTGANFGPGGILLVNGNLLIQSDTGSLVLARPSSAGYSEIARTNGVLSGTSWNSPAVCKGRIYARSTTEGVCLDAAPAPEAQFTAVPTNGIAPLTVTFTDRSVGDITNRFWAFGDGWTMGTTDTNCTHAYSWTPAGDVNKDRHVAGSDSLLINQVLVGRRATNDVIFCTNLTACLTVQGPSGASTNDQPGCIGLGIFPNGNVNRSGSITSCDPLLINQATVGLRAYLITGIVPNSRTNGVPTPVTICGIGFPTNTVSGVTIGPPVNLTLSNVVVVSREQITALVPAGGGLGTGTVGVVATPTNGVVSFGRFVNQ